MRPTSTAHSVAAALVAAAVILAALALPGPAHAIDDPSLDYRTLTTPHFYVHYYDGTEALARRVATMAEEAHQILSPLLAWTPDGRTHVVVNDKVDTANGSANVYGRNIIRVYGMPPEPEGVLGYYDDWLRILVYHEYVHILHLDTTHEEAAFLNRLIGKQLNPNQVLPRWYIEGLATLYESRRTGTGRVNSSLFRMWLRTAALHDEFFDLGQASGIPIDWPMGSAAYLYGSFFLDYVTRTRGEGFAPKFNHLYGSRIVPFSMNQAASEVGGDHFQAMWEEWTAAATGEALAERVAVRARGETPLEFVTDDGGASRFPRVRPGHGQMSFYRSSLTDHPEFALTPTTVPRWEELFEPDGAGGTHDWSPDGQTLYYTRRRIVDQVYSYDAIFGRHEPTGRSWRITDDDERAREPAVSPDGRRLAYVRNLPGTTELVVRELRAGPGPDTTVLLGGSQWPGDDERHWQQISRPAWRPDGRAIAFSWWRADRRQRDLWLYDFDAPEGQRLRQLTDDAAQDLAPYFGDDGLIYFSSDRTRIFNAFALNPDTQKVWQLSNVVSGVFEPTPSPDGRWIYVSAYTADGYEIARFPRPQRMWHPAPAAFAGPARRDYPAVDAEAFADGDYQPWRWMAPLMFTPEISLLLDGAGFGGTINGEDPVGHHGYRLSGAWATDSETGEQTAGFGAAYGYGGWPVSLGLSANYRTYPRTRSYVAGSDYIPFTESAWSGGLSLAYPLRSVSESLALRGGWRFRYTDFFDAEPDPTNDPFDIEPTRPEHGLFNEYTFGLSYADVERYPLAASTTNGVTGYVNLRVQQDLTGDASDALILNYGAGGYLANPWLETHVFALNLTGGIIRSSTGRDPRFAIGGHTPQDVLTSVILAEPQGQFVLRGYPPALLRGSQYQVWKGEYRFPLVDLDEGFSTVPVFFRRMKGAVFVDTGGAFDGYLADADYRTALGAEVQLDAIFGYYLGGALRTGIARGIDAGGITEWYLRYGGGF